MANATSCGNALEIDFSHVTSSYGNFVKQQKVYNSPFAHLPLYTLFPFPQPPQILHNLCFPFLLGITTVPRESESNAYAEFLGAKKVHFGRCASGE